MKHSTAENNTIGTLDTFLHLYQVDFCFVVVKNTFIWMCASYISIQLLRTHLTRKFGHYAVQESNCTEHRGEHLKRQT